MENKENTEKQEYCGTYEVHHKDQLVGRQELDTYGVSVLYINYQGIDGYTINKIK